MAFGRAEDGQALPAAEAKELWEAGQDVLHRMSVVHGAVEGVEVLLAEGGGSLAAEDVTALGRLADLLGDRPRFRLAEVAENT